MKYALVFLCLPTMLSAHPIDDAIVTRDMQAEPLIKELSPEKKEEYLVYAHQLNIKLWELNSRLSENPESENYALERNLQKTHNLAQIIMSLQGK